MRISLNWLKKYVDIPVSNEELVRLIGARLVEVEDVIDETKKYDGIFVVEVKSAEKIPDTHLTRCLIDDGGKCEGKIERDENGLIQVMCGAPNVRVGMLAAWIAPGAVVPASVNEDAPFVIGKRKMLGQYDSYGMLSGADELDLGDDHTGIVELDPETAKAGDLLADVLDLRDLILDIENKSLTHRPDCFGLIGFAREVAGILGQPFSTPDFLTNFESTGVEAKADLSVCVEDVAICPRYTATVLERRGDFRKKKYLSEMDVILAKAGMRPIEPIVDMTNYLMLLTGQPLHAFDYDKFVAVGNAAEPEIRVRSGRAGEKLVLLDDKEVELVDTDVVICSGDTPVALGGAMGGKDTEIDENTRKVILEAASFSLYNMRKTQMAHGIFSEAITRFTKGQPVGQVLAVAREFARLMGSQFETLGEFDSFDAGSDEAGAAGATSADELYLAETVTVPVAQANTLLGTEFTAEAMAETLENVEFKVELAGENLVVMVPYWRTDIHIVEDVIEEIGRLNGYDNITPTNPYHATYTKNPMVALKNSTRDFLSRNGANEVLSYSFVEGDNFLRNVALQDAEQGYNAYRIVNSIAPALEYFRPLIAASLLEKAGMNANSKGNYNDFVLYEMNQVARKSDGLTEEGVPTMHWNLALVAVDKAATSQFYEAKLYLAGLMAKLNIAFELTEFTAEADGRDALYIPKRSANIVVDGVKVGVIGEVKLPVLKKVELPEGTAAFEVDLGLLVGKGSLARKTFELSKFPKVKRDLNIATTASYGEVYDALVAKLEKMGLMYTVEPVSIFQKDGAAEQNLTFHLEFANREKTLTAEEIAEIIAKLEKA